MMKMINEQYHFMTSSEITNKLGRTSSVTQLNENNVPQQATLVMTMHYTSYYTVEYTYQYFKNLW